MCALTVVAMFETLWIYLLFYHDFLVAECCYCSFLRMSAFHAVASFLFFEQCGFGGWC